MKELIKRVFKDQKKDEEINTTYYVVQFDYRYPLELFGEVMLNYYGSTAKVVDQYLRMGWAFRDRKQAEQLAAKLNNKIKSEVKQWN
jgi:hypothetical protein